MHQILSQLIALQERPAPFTPGEPLFWDDPHISAQMLEFHLNPEVEAASRKPETIDRSVQWLIAALGLEPGDTLLDLGCGPGALLRQKTGGEIQASVSVRRVPIAAITGVTSKPQAAATVSNDWR